MARRSRSFSNISELCRAARVMTMRLPARDDWRNDDSGAEGSATLATHIFQDVLRAGFDKQVGHAFAKGAGLLGRCGGALLNVLKSVDGAHAGVEDQFVILDARPSA